MLQVPVLVPVHSRLHVPPGTIVPVRTCTTGVHMYTCMYSIRGYIRGEMFLKKWTLDIV